MSLTKKIRVFENKRKKERKKEDRKKERTMQTMKENE